MLILFVKSQLPLFDTPVHVAAHVRKDGTVVAPHMRIQKVAMKPAAHRNPTPDMFAGQAATETAPKRTKLDTFIARHGGPTALASTIRGFTPRQQDALLAQMAAVGGQDVDKLREVLGLGKHQPASPDEPAAVRDGDIAENPKIENILANVAIDSVTGESTKSIPPQLLRKFVYSLFQSGHNQVGDLRIVSWNSDDRDGRNPLWDDASKAEFEKFGLLEKVAHHGDRGGHFYAISKDLGASVWRVASKPNNQLTPETKAANEAEKSKAGIYEQSDGESPEYKQIAALSNQKYKDTPIEELQARRDKLENERSELMRGVARAQAAGRGSRTAVSVAEGSAERYAGIIQKLDVAISEKKKQHSKSENNASGDVVASVAAVNAEAKKYGLSVEKEINKYIEGAWFYSVKKDGSAIGKLYPDESDGFFTVDVGEGPAGTFDLQDAMNEVATTELSSVVQVPREGERNADGLVFRDGRWHRDAADHIEQPLAIVDHVTGKGKTLRGVVRTDLDGHQAAAIDPYTFRKNGGWFIREKYLTGEKTITSEASDSKTVTPDHAAADEPHETAKRVEVAATETASKAQAAKLRAAGEKLLADSQADYGRDRNSNTARRARMASGAEAEAAKRMATAKTMINLADAIDDGEARYLKGVTTRVAVETLDGALTSAIYEADRNLSYQERQQRSGRPPEADDIRLAKLPVSRWGTAGSDSGKLIEALKGKRGAAELVAKIRRSAGPDAEILKGLKKHLSDKDIQYNVGWYNIEAVQKLERLSKLGIKTDHDLRLALTEFVMYRDGHKAVDPIKAAERALVGKKVGFDFFPTPKALAATMAEKAGIKPGMSVLEPSAGNGILADAARDAGASVDAVEISDALRNVLSAKGHTLAAHDFETFEPGQQYDIVLMNPPFSDRKDAAHIMRAWDMVKPGGKLVAIAGEGVFFGSDKKAVAFREWLDEHGAEVEKLPDNTFMGADQIAQTGANARLISMVKPAAVAKMKNFGWDRVKLSDAYSLPELEALRQQVIAEHANPKDEAGHPMENGQRTINLYDKKGRDKLANLAWAVTYKLKDKEATQATAQSADAGPRDGERNAEGLVFRDGRWHRDESEAAPAVAEQPSPAPATNPEFEAAEDRADLAEAMAEDPHSEKSKRMLANVAQRHADAEAPAEPEADKPSSANYRYADTGYIAGSRKEMAAAQVIAKAKKDGARVHETAIDWEALEANPREAKELITKSNLFGQVDWDTLKAGGMEPGAGFLIDRIYAAIGQEPSEDKPSARRDYALGLRTLRDRLEGCATPDQVSKVLDNLREEYDGKILTAEESVLYQALSKKSAAAWEEDRAIDEAGNKLYRASNIASGEASSIRYEIQKRENRKWVPKPELAEKLAAATVAADAAHAAWSADLHATRARRDELKVIRQEAHHAQQAITLMAYARNQLENPLHRAWNLMGERFVNVLRYRSYKGSDAFANHVAVAKTGKVKDWSWAEKTTARAPRISKESARFQLKVADTYERVGGRAVTPHSTMELKEMFGLRDVQSGNWVLRDVASAKFHTENCAAAFADLADLLGAPDKHISLNGRLAMAFGARGSGAKGFKDGAASAHYESVHRVINLTKMGGGGSLGHEFFHAFDNIAKEAEGMGQSGVDDYATANPDILPPGELRDAFRALRSAMLDGEHRATETVEYSAHDVKVAAHNLGGRFVNGVGQKILAAGDVHAAVQAVDEYFKINTDAKLTPKTKKLARDWRKIAVAHYGGNADGGTVDVKGGPAMSAFAMGAAQLDQGGTAYWSQTIEMAARGFQSWIEDRLGEMGRKNDYLSSYADNKYHRDPLTGMEWKPYPEGAERERINAAFDRVFAAVGASGTLAKAMAMGRDNIHD